jgi:hypothetical protein
MGCPAKLEKDRDGKARANTMITAITVTLIAIRVSMVIPFSIRLFFLP